MTPRTVRRKAAPTLAVALALPLLAAPALVEAQPRSGASDAARVIEEVITPETYYNRLAFLASDALQGRDTPSVGLEVAAEWLRSEHRRMGLEPGADGGSFFQRWPYRQIRSDVAEAHLALVGPGGETSIDAVTSPLRGASVGPIDGELVFVANLSAAPEAGSMAGKVLVAYAPGSFSQPWLQQLNRLNTFAEASGAQGSIVVVDGDFGAEAMEGMRARFAAAPWRYGAELVIPAPQLVIPRATADAAIPGFAALAAGHEAGDTFTAEVAGARLRGDVPAHVVDGAPANVVAILPGTDPALRNEFVVLSAHYDHVGIGTPLNGDSIYNGADDNGSGTVALLEVANALRQLPEGERPRRSIAFVHVSGEEKGLLGSRWFVDNPPEGLPVERMIANINADMIGGDLHRDTLVVIGKTYSTLGPLVDELNASMPQLRLTTSDDLWPEQRFFFRSDQLHFMRKEIPSLFFFTGVHECYHRPCDTVDRLDVDKASRVARLLAHATLEIANRDERPSWYPEGLAEVRERTGGGP
jgi:hypothetical protein